jgi:hypothetical protein
MWPTTIHRDIHPVCQVLRLMVSKTTGTCMAQPSKAGAQGRSSEAHTCNPARSSTTHSQGQARQTPYASCTPAGAQHTNTPATRFHAAPLATDISNQVRCITTSAQHSRTTAEPRDSTTTQQHTSSQLPSTPSSSKQHPGYASH